jgi:uncharacterized linocin/CFP29 family protein
MDQLDWDNTQRELVGAVIDEEVNKARLSHNFIDISQPPLAEDARNVRADRYDRTTNLVDDVTTIPLVEISAPLILTPAQTVDKDLSSALLLIRRAANKLARAHDEIIFVGQPDAGKLPPKATALGLTANWGSTNKGLFETGNEVVVRADKEAVGEALVGAVAEALVKLEDAGYIGSYVLIFGQVLFTYANTPTKGSMVLPSDRMKNLMELPEEHHVHRSSVLEDDTGLLLSLSGQPMDRAVAVKPKFEFQQIGADNERRCRVFERFALRLKEKDSVVKFRLTTKP